MANEEISETLRQMLDDMNADHPELAELDEQGAIDTRHCFRCGAEPGQPCRNIYRPTLLVPPHFGRTA